ncbi:MAG: hypothetical protein WD826_02550, partial [Actinomycetota bacterium]
TIDAGPENGSTTGGSTSFTFSSAASDVDHFVCSLDGADFAACTSPVDYTNLSDGTHTFTVRAVDDVGNMGAPASRTWTVDGTAPVVTIDWGPKRRTDSKKATFHFHSEPAGVPLECSLDGKAFASCTSPVHYKNLKVGKHTFQVRATDAARNVGLSELYTWRITR